MKLLAINLVFLMVIGLITAIAVIGIFLAIRNFSISYFTEKASKFYREVRVYVFDSVNQNFLYELIYSCLNEAKEKNCSNYIVCYYISSFSGFSNLKFPYEEYVDGYKIDFSDFNYSKQNIIIVNFCKEKIVKVLN